MEKNEKVMVRFTINRVMRISNKIDDMRLYLNPIVYSNLKNRLQVVSDAAITVAHAIDLSGLKEEEPIESFKKSLDSWEECFTSEALAPFN